MMTLKAQTVLVTGASRGLGLEYVKQLLMFDSVELLIATCRNPESESAIELLSIAKLNPVVKIVKLDVENDESLESAFQEVRHAVGESGLNLLISNAAIYDRSDSGGILVQSREKMQTHFNVNVTGPILLVQKFLPLLQQASKSKSKDPLSCSRSGIVMMSSRVGSQNIAFNDGPEASLSLHYKCSKTALNMATILISREVKKDGILAFALHPGWVKTKMGTDRAPMYPCESIEKCLKVIAGVGEEIHGKLIDLNGEIIPF
ncbi:C-factor-like [Biomphalaria glabrata]|uniref:C-factor-like n=1 Tax=Biomphalaria glabrata TaxID=6526 RepID=A0A9U8DV57_BIOGL|nr:C-factor-like [Biomphalaria glabrata]